MYGRSFWFFSLVPFFKKARGLAVGFVVVMSENILENDVKHELVHVSQHIQYPLIFSLMYFYQSFKHGYRNNKFEDEAYMKAKNSYLGDKT